MVNVASNSLLYHYPREYYIVFVFVNFIVLFAIVSFCTWCWKRKESLTTEEDGNVDHDDDDDDDNNEEELYDSFEMDMPLSRRPLLDNRGRTLRSSSFPLDARTKTHIHLQQPERKKRSLKDSLRDSLAPFYNIPIQPTFEEFLPHDSPYARSLSVPEILPEAPICDTDDLGSIHFAISYDVYELVLKVLIQKATNLPAKDIIGTSDPYVKVMLLPDRKLKLETRIRKRNLNPTWNEVLCFEGFPHDVLTERVVNLEVLDYDRFSRNDSIGEVELPLADVSLQSEPIEFEKKLRPCKHSCGHPGDLLVSMCYNPSFSRITLVVMKCARLKSMDVSGKSDPYVKVYLLYSGRRIDKKKTEIVKRSLNPVWNELMEFEVPFDKIREISFVLTVMDFDTILPNKHIGKVIIGHRSSGTGLKQWTDMLHNPRTPVAMWHNVVKY